MQSAFFNRALPVVYTLQLLETANDVKHEHNIACYMFSTQQTEEGLHPPEVILDLVHRHITCPAAAVNDLRIGLPRWSPHAEAGSFGHKQYPSYA